jgi:hypothetical protein
VSVLTRMGTWSVLVWQFAGSFARVRMTSLAYKTDGSFRGSRHACFSPCIRGHRKPFINGLEASHRKEYLKSLKLIGYFAIIRDGRARMAVVPAAKYRYHLVHIDSISGYLGHIFYCTVLCQAATQAIANGGYGRRRAGHHKNKSRIKFGA